MKKRSRPRRSTDKRGPAKLTPRRKRAAIRRKFDVAVLAMDEDDVFNQA